ncbi:MAG: ADP-ribosylglycohydrolase family protein [Burkholderiales bacterium]
MTAIIRLGGDADTTAAIVGALVGARVGKSGIPAEWLNNLVEWPRTVIWMEQLSARLAASRADQSQRRSVWINPVMLLLRNAVFMVIVLLHGFRRLLPPY